MENSKVKINILIVQVRKLQLGLTVSTWLIRDSNESLTDLQAHVCTFTLHDFIMLNVLKISLMKK